MSAGNLTQVLWIALCALNCWTISPATLMFFFMFMKQQWNYCFMEVSSFNFNKHNMLFYISVALKIILPWVFSFSLSERTEIRGRSKRKDNKHSHMLSKDRSFGTCGYYVSSMLAPFDDHLVENMASNCESNLQRVKPKKYTHIFMYTMYTHMHRHLLTAGISLLYLSLFRIPQSFFFPTSTPSLCLSYSVCTGFDHTCLYWTCKFQWSIISSHNLWEVSSIRNLCWARCSSTCL